MINHQIQAARNQKGKLKFSACPSVIDESVIKESLARYFEESKIPQNLDLFPFSEIIELSLSFQNIHKIQNLNGLVKLQKLQLDNNIIEKIENISHLTKLKWLDLSFNCIQKIEGLNTLTELQDLSLFSNEIKKVENIDNCTKLNVLSLGNNKIADLESFYLYLRDFKKLEVLNIAGNPFTKKDSEYKLYLMFYLPTLKYLDYSFIDKAMREMINEDEKLRNEAAAEASKAKDNAIKEEEQRVKKVFQEECKAARVDILNLFPQEIKSDPDLEKLEVIRGVKDEVVSMIDLFNEDTEELQKAITEKNKKKLEVMEKFKSEYYQSIKENEDEAKKSIMKFDNIKKHKFRKIEEGEVEDIDEILIELAQGLEELKDELMNTELEFIEIETQSILDFKRLLEEYTADMNETVTKNLEKYRENVGNFQNAIKKVTDEEVQAFTDHPEDYLKDFPENDQGDIENLLDNRDGLGVIISQVIESLQGKIYKKETDITNSIKKDADDFYKKLKTDQYERNRRNIENIESLVEKFREEINDKQVKEVDDDDDYN